MIKIRTLEDIKEKPCYELTLIYNLGGRGSSAIEEKRFEIEDGDAIEYFCKILDKLTPKKTHNYDGLVLDTENDPGIRRWENLTDIECLIWDKLVFNYVPDVTEENPSIQVLLMETFKKQSGKFKDMVLVSDGDEYYFYEGYVLEYIDEYGETHGTYFED